MGLCSTSKFLFLPKTLAKVILDRTRAEYKGAQFHEWNRVTNDQPGGNGNALPRGLPSVQAGRSGARQRLPEIN